MRAVAAPLDEPVVSIGGRPGSVAEPMTESVYFFRSNRSVLRRSQSIQSSGPGSGRGAGAACNRPESAIPWARAWVEAIGAQAAARASKRAGPC